MKTMDLDPQSLKNQIIKFIKDFVAQSPQNTLTFDFPEVAWNEPLVGFSSGSDPIYTFFKKDIGSFYWLPHEAYNLAFGGSEKNGDKLTVISWIIPQTKQTKSDQRKMNEFPSERWARARLSGEDFNNLMRKTITEEITKLGYPAFAPMLLESFQRETSEKYGYASSWSERHAAFAAGLGTFGLSDGLITPVGKSIRCGTVIAELNLPADPRPYDHHNSYCLFHFDGSCKKCAERCPADAINENGHDKKACHDYIRNITTPYTEREFGIKVTSCGLCQAKVPCESFIPPKIRNHIKAVDQIAT